jgi:hypothetical protein
MLSLYFTPSRQLQYCNISTYIIPTGPTVLPHLFQISIYYIPFSVDTEPLLTNEVGKI